MTPQTKESGAGEAEPVVARPRLYAEAAIACTAIAGVATSLLAAPDVRGWLGAGLALVVLAIAVVDARRLIIPDEMNAAALGLGLVSAAVQDSEAALAAVAGAVLRGTFLALLFLGIRVGYRRLREREGLGLGDVKLAGVAGAWLDWLTIPVAIEIAAVAALTTYLVLRYGLGRSMRSTSRLPFGLFFAPAIWAGWLLEATTLTLFHF